MKPKERISWIDTAKGICMVFVMISHAYPPTSWIRLFTPFFLPCFFFLSGYTFKSGDGIVLFLIRKVKSLVVPMIMFSLVNGFVGVIFKGKTFTDRLLGIVIQQAGGYESLWFFPCLFVCEILFFVIVCTLKSEKRIFLGSFIVACIGYVYIAYIGYALPWQFELGCINVLFLSFGYFYRLHEKNIQSVCNKPSVFTLLLFFYVMLCLCYDNDVNMHDEQFGIQALFIIEAFIGIMLIVTVSQWMPEFRSLLYIGSHTIVYFSFQGFLLQTIRKILIKLFGFEGGGLCILSVLVALPVLSIASFVIYKYFPFMLGKTRKRCEI